MLSRPSRVRLTAALLGAATVLALPAAAQASWRPPVVMFESGCRADCMAMGPGPMPMGMSMDDLMGEYADPAHATVAERHRAWHLLGAVWRASRKFQSLAMAERMGYRKGFAMAAIGQHWPTPFVHYDNRHLWFDGRNLDPGAPESLVYWIRPHHPALLVGFMFRAPSNAPAPDPVGPLLRWHVHARCVSRRAAQGPRGLRARRQCRSGFAQYGPTQMVHVYLTHDLVSAYAQDVPTRALHIPLPKAPSSMGGMGSGSQGMGSMPMPKGG